MMPYVGTVDGGRNIEVGEGREVMVGNKIHSDFSSRLESFHLDHLFPTRPMPRVPSQKAMFVVIYIWIEACLFQESRSPRDIVEESKTAPRDQSRVQLVACSQ